MCATYHIISVSFFETQCIIYSYGNENDLSIGLVETSGNSKCLLSGI